jgi:hypothetical protein
MTETNTTIVELSPAERLYQKHKAICKKYQQVHAKEINERNKQFYKHMKENCPDKYKHFLAYHKEYAKKRRLDKKNALHPPTSPTTTIPVV